MVNSFVCWNVSCGAKSGIGGASMFRFLRGIALIVAMILNCGAAVAEPWNSVQQCYNMHIRVADGAYPQRDQGDDPSELREYCERAYKAKSSSFSGRDSGIHWVVACCMSNDRHRYARMRSYFGKPCGFWKNLSGGCTAEGKR